MLQNLIYEEEELIKVPQLEDDLEKKCYYFSIKLMLWVLVRIALARQCQ